MKKIFTLTIYDEDHIAELLNNKYIKREDIISFNKTRVKTVSSPYDSNEFMFLLELEENLYKKIWSHLIDKFPQYYNCGQRHWYFSHYNIKDDLEDNEKEFKENNKPELDAFQTALLLGTKGFKIKETNLYWSKEEINYIKESENKIIKNYSEYILGYLNIVCIPYNSFQLRHLCDLMLEVFNIVAPKKYSNLIRDLSSFYNNDYSIVENLFKQLYGHLQATQMRDDDGEFFELDFSYIDEKQNYKKS